MTCSETKAADEKDKNKKSITGASVKGGKGGRAGWSYLFEQHKKYCTAIVLAWNKEDIIKRKAYCHYLTLMRWWVNQKWLSMSILCLWLIGIVVRNVHWLSCSLVPSNCSNVVETHTLSHNNVTCIFCGDLEPMNALEPGLDIRVVISTLAHALQWATSWRCCGPGSASG